MPYLLSSSVLYDILDVILYHPSCSSPALFTPIHHRDCFFSVPELPLYLSIYLFHLHSISGYTVLHPTSPLSAAIATSYFTALFDLGQPTGQLISRRRERWTTIEARHFPMSSRTSHPVGTRSPSQESNWTPRRPRPRMVMLRCS